LSAQLMVVGLSHKTAPVELRERLVVPERLLPEELDRLMKRARLNEGVLISTCNRVELVGASADPQAAAEAVIECFNGRAAPDPVNALVYRHLGREAVRHLFRVAAGLEAMVLGEPQILGQVKEAFAAAQRSGHVHTLLGRWFDRAFSVAKRVRSETAIAEGCVSVSSVACNLAEKIFGELSGRRVLLVGAGKMSEISARTLAVRGARLIVVNRNSEKAEQMARSCGGEPRAFEAISSTSSPGFVITRELMQETARERRRRPLFFIDIAVPRDVDPAVRSFDNVFLYDIDDLQKVSETNLESRRRALPAAERIIEGSVDQFDRWLRSLQLSPTITALRDRFRAVVLEEKQKTLPRLTSVSEKDRRALDAMCEALVNKLLHQPLTELKRGSDGGDESALIETTQRLFHLEIPEAGEGADKP
jgi:glutamyl-tRNA reductase